MVGAKKGAKTSSLAVHPNSRKAGQVIKRLAHDNRVAASKKLRERKDAAFRAQVEWFQNEIEKWNRALCPHEFDVLIEKYIQRNEEEVQNLEESGKSTKDSFKVDELRRRATNEADWYTTSGLAVPNLLCNKGFATVKDWGSNVIDLSKIPTKKFKRSNISSLPIGSACKTALQCTLHKSAENIDVDKMVG